MTLKTLAKILSFAALAGTILPSLLVFFGVIGLESAQSAMLVATIAWFAVTPLWMGRGRGAPAPSD